MTPEQEKAWESVLEDALWTINIRSKYDKEHFFKDELSANGAIGKAKAIIAKGNECAYLRSRIEELEQTSGELCPECYWRGMRDGPCEFCRNKELEEENSRLRDAVHKQPCECLDEYGEKFRIDCWRCIALQGRRGDGHI